MAIPLRAVLLAVFIHTLWGGNMVALKFSLLAIPPLWSGFWRFLLASLCLILWARLRGISVLPVKGEWTGLCLLGAGFFIQVGLMNLGTDFTTGAVSSILIATSPLFASLLAHFFIPGDRLRPLRSMGLLVAFLGIAMLFAVDVKHVLEQQSTWGNVIVLISAVMLGGRLTFTASLVRQIEPLRVMLWQMIISLPAFAIAGLLFEQVDWAALDWRPVAGIAYQGVIVAGFAFMVNAYLLRRYSPSVVISFNFVSPLAGVIASEILLGEVITWNLWAGLTAVGLGLILINKK